MRSYAWVIINFNYERYLLIYLYYFYSIAVENIKLFCVLIFERS